VTALGLAHLTALDLPPPELIRAASRAGFAAVGLRVHPAVAGGAAYPTRVGTAAHRDLAALLRAEGISLNDVEFIQLTPDIDIQAFRPMLEAASDLGAASVTVSGDDSDQARLTANFAALCDLTQPLGLRVDLEFMRWRVIGNLQSAAAIVRQAGKPNGAVLVDALHLHRSGGAPADLTALGPGTVRAAQLCDAGAAIPQNDAGIIAEAREGRLPPGQGVLPLREMLRALPAKIALSVEMPMASIDTLSRIALAYSATQRVLATHMER
jgi:sugar phosphate isomerase/epimerase